MSTILTDAPYEISYLTLIIILEEGAVVVWVERGQLRNVRLILKVVLPFLRTA